LKKIQYKDAFALVQKSLSVEKIPHFDKIEIANKKSLPLGYILFCQAPWQVVRKLTKKRLLGNFIPFFKRL